ncbi:hypothetical protein ACU82A_29940 [Bacillus cereus]
MKKTVSTLERQLEDTLKNSSLSIEKDGIKYDFDSIQDGKFLFKNEDKTILIPPHEIEKNVSKKELEIDGEKPRTQAEIPGVQEESGSVKKEPVAEKMLNLTELEKDLSETLKKSSIYC